MKFLKYTLLAVALTVLMPAQSQAKPIVTLKGYLFGFIANFTDSVVYFTDIQTVDSVWYDHKTQFLLGRSSYANQLRDYFTNSLSIPHRTCVVVFALTRKDAEKKYLKLKRQYTVKHAGHYDVRNLNENEFHFTSVNMAPDDEPVPQVKEKKDKKSKKKGRSYKRDGKRPPRDGKMPPKPRN